MEVSIFERLDVLLGRQSLLTGASRTQHLRDSFSGTDRVRKQNENALPADAGKIVGRLDGALEVECLSGIAANTLHPPAILHFVVKLLQLELSAQFLQLQRSSLVRLIQRLRNPRRPRIVPGRNASLHALDLARDGRSAALLVDLIRRASGEHGSVDAAQFALEFVSASSQFRLPLVGTLALGRSPAGGDHVLQVRDLLLQYLSALRQQDSLSLRRPSTARRLLQQLRQAGAQLADLLRRALTGDRRLARQPSLGVSDVLLQPHDGAQVAQGLLVCIPRRAGALAVVGEQLAHVGLGGIRRDRLHVGGDGAHDRIGIFLAGTDTGHHKVADVLAGDVGRVYRRQHLSGRRRIRLGGDRRAPRGGKQVGPLVTQNLETVAERRLHRLDPVAERRRALDDLIHADVQHIGQQRDRVGNRARLPALARHRLSRLYALHGSIGTSLPILHCRLAGLLGAPHLRRRHAHRLLDGLADDDGLFVLGDLLSRGSEVGFCCLQLLGQRFQAGRLLGRQRPALRAAQLRLHRLQGEVGGHVPLHELSVAAPLAISMEGGLVDFVDLGLSVVELATCSGALLGC